jgi:hypothetical protein
MEGKFDRSIRCGIIAAREQRLPSPTQSARRAGQLTEGCSRAAKLTGKQHEIR